MSAETYTGKPCAHGHTLRYRSNRKCVKCSTREVRYLAVLDGDIYGGLHNSPFNARAQAPADAELWRAVKVD